jgi:hypothetical protein
MEVDQHDINSSQAVLETRRSFFPKAAALGALCAESLYHILQPQTLMGASGRECFVRTFEVDRMTLIPFLQRNDDPLLFFYVLSPVSDDTYRICYSRLIPSTADHKQRRLLCEDERFIPMKDSNGHYTVSFFSKGGFVRIVERHMRHSGAPPIRFNQIIPQNQPDLSIPDPIEGSSG